MNLEQQAGFAGLDEQVFGVKQFAFVQARRAGQGRNGRQGLELVLVEHLPQAWQRHGLELATGQLFKAVEVQELALREQHQQGANLVIEQDRLHPRRGGQRWMFRHLFKGNVQLFEQQPDYRRCVRGCGVQGNFSHGLYPFVLLNAKYNQPVGKAGSILGRASHLPILLTVAQPAV